MKFNARNSLKMCAVALVSSAACVAFAKGASFFAPEKIYAVPGVECAVHYTRLFDSYTPGRYALEALSKKGRAYSDRWCFTATEKEAGTKFPLVLNAWDDDVGLVASITTTVVVAREPSPEAKSRKITLALLGASGTNCRYQDRVMEQMRRNGFSGYTPVGSRHPEKSTGVCESGEFIAAHDGYGGYSWGSFLTRYALTVDEIDNVQAAAEREQLKSFGVKLAPGNEWRKSLLKSPLLRIKDGKKVVDVQAWFDKINGGSAPDYIVIALGGNGVWIQRPDSNQGKVDEEVAQAHKLVPILRAAAPNAVIAIMSSVGGSLDQDSWGHNYGAVQSCFIGNKSFIAYNRAMKEFCEKSGDPNLVFVPVSQGVSHLDGYPKGRKSGNALHPNQIGGRQLGDALFAWLATDAAERWR